MLGHLKRFARALTIALAYRGSLPAEELATKYLPAYFENIPTKPAQVSLPLFSAQPVTVELPELPKDLSPIVFSPDGKSIYGAAIDPKRELDQVMNLARGNSFDPNLRSSEGIIKVGFKPPRMSIVVGSDRISVHQRGGTTFWKIVGSRKTTRHVEVRRV